jgi:hypothetical protein
VVTVTPSAGPGIECEARERPDSGGEGTRAQHTAQVGSNVISKEVHFRARDGSLLPRERAESSAIESIASWTNALTPT